jgi:DNA-binding beta-propeller fold protein YncE
MRTRMWLGMASAALAAWACGGDGGNTGYVDEPVQGPGPGRTPTFVVDPSWPKIPNDWILGITSGLAIDAENNIWVLQRPRTLAPEDAAHAAPPVLVFDTAGDFIKGWGGDGAEYEWPGTEHGIFVDHNDYVWIAGSGPGDDQILKFTTDGDFVMQIGHAGRSRGNTDTLNVNRAADVYVYPPTNELFVADGYGNRRVIVFDAETGRYKRMWGAFGNPPTDPPPSPGGRGGRGRGGGAAAAADTEADRAASQNFDLVHGVRVSNDGLVYVSDRGGMRFQVFTIDGEYVTQVMVGRNEVDSAAIAERVGDTMWGRPASEWITMVNTAHQSASRSAFSADPEQRYLFIADRSNQQVITFDRISLQPLSRFGRVGNRPGEFYVLHDMVADPRGNLYTAEVQDGRRAQKFSLTGYAPVSPM